MSQEHTLIKGLATWAPQHASDWQDDAFYEPLTRRVYTVDAFIEGVHFRRDWMTWRAVGHKCAAAAWSDVAAMGACPLFWMVSLGLPNELAHSTSAIESLYRGMMDALAGWPGAPPALIGGDTVQAPQLTLSITAIGEVPHGHQVGLRCTARPGDVVVCTGWPGLSALGLQAMANGWQANYPQAVKAHEYPIPQFQAGLALAALNTRFALMDTSDGLADAVLQIAQASSVSIKLIGAQLPIHPELRAAQQAGRLDALETAFYGGEDFELVACLPPELFAQLQAHHRAMFQPIGHVQSLLDTTAATAYCLDEATGCSTLLDQDRTYKHFALSPSTAPQEQLLP
jgi:thiamine-monophosphate kinase